MSRSLSQIFRAPAVIALASAVGLVSALVADGLWDMLSWFALGAAVVLAVWHGVVSPSPAKAQPAASTARESEPPRHNATL